MEGDPKTRSAKRARGGADMASFCSVDGCESDLSKCKEYHRRHKVCEAHSKTPVVLVRGQQQRFCQQCSRFHLLGEFDEVKRSCRKRLDGHNRRRRKPQLPSISGRIVPNPHGLGFYGRAQAFSIAAAIPPKCLPLAKSGENSLFKSHLIINFDNNQQHSISNYGGGKQFPFLQDDGSMTIDAKEMAVEDPALRSLDTILPPECGNNGTSKTFSGSLPRVLHPSSAPSLLSSMTQTSTSNLYPIVPAMNQLPFGQPSVGLDKYHHSHISNHVLPTTCLEIENDNVGALLVPDASDIDHRYSSIFHVGGGGSPDGPLQAVPFSWS